MGVAVEQEAEGADEDAQVQAEGPVAYIADVAFHSPLHLPETVGGAAVSVDLCQSGDAGFDRQPFGIAIYQRAVEKGWEIFRFKGNL